MGGVHPPEDVEDALSQLDTRVPLLYSELRVIAQGLWDSAFREGARQGRRAGTEAGQNHLRAIAGATPDPQVNNLLLDIAASFDSPHAEYQDPTEAIREKLAEKARTRNGL